MKCSVTLSSTIVFVSPQSASLLVPPVNCHNSSSPIPMQEKKQIFAQSPPWNGHHKCFWVWEIEEVANIGSNPHHCRSPHCPLFFSSSRNNQTNNAVEVPRKCENNYWPLQMCTGFHASTQLHVPLNIAIEPLQCNDCCTSAARMHTSKCNNIYSWSTPQDVLPAPFLICVSSCVLLLPFWCCGLLLLWGWWWSPGADEHRPVSWLVADAEKPELSSIWQTFDHHHNRHRRHHRRHHQQQRHRYHHGDHDHERAKSRETGALLCLANTPFTPLSASPSLASSSSSSWSAWSDFVDFDDEDANISHHCSNNHSRTEANKLYSLVYHVNCSKKLNKLQWN